MDWEERVALLVLAELLDEDDERQRRQREEEEEEEERQRRQRRQREEEERQREEARQRRQRRQREEEERRSPISFHKAVVEFGVIRDHGPGALWSFGFRSAVPLRTTTGVLIRPCFDGHYVKSTHSDFVINGDLAAFGEATLDAARRSACASIYVPYAALQCELPAQLGVEVIVFDAQENLFSSVFEWDWPTLEERGERNFLAALVNAAVAAATVDGPLQRAQRWAIHGFLMDELELNATGEDALRFLLQVADDTQLDFRDLVLQLAPYLTPDDHDSFVGLLYAGASAAEPVSTEQHDLILKLCNVLGIAYELVLAARGEYELTQAYQALELPPGSSWDEVRSAYRRLALDNHPDKFQNHPEGVRRKANQKMVDLNVAMELLAEHLKAPGTG